MPQFSIITPTWNRADGRLQRCLSSVLSQSFQDFEMIVVDDHSTDITSNVAAYFSSQFASLETNLTFIAMPEHRGRVVARNVGMKFAKGDFLVWLDSDDALDPMYLATFAHYIEQEPDARLWICGSRYHGMIKTADGEHICPKWTRLRQAWIPPVDTNGVHQHFPSGLVGTGMFVFHRECLEKTGLMPDWINHNKLADSVDEWLGYTTGYSSKTKTCGNPWGDDWAMLRKLTMHYRAHKIDACLYNQYVR